ncbi:MAG: cysteine desulfurase-like protein [Chloroflexota bacterium]|nr:cysteine desulfurase-like protein [Chloroflexota bacterium]MDE2948358.1 cysteine desulfurase-like protein [Chloroflexota bacterium]
MTFHAEAIRPLFPSLNHDGTAPIFLDNPAGTQVPRPVMDAVTQYYLTMNANSGGAFATSRRSDEMTQMTRERMADFLNASSPSEIIIGPNMTTLCFSLSRAISPLLSAGDEIVLTRMDHDANIAPWLQIARERNLTVKWVDIRRDDCTLDMDSLEEALSERSKIVATVHASNAVGTINPVKQIAGMARAVGAWHVVDAVQSAPHVPIDVLELGCDFLLCSSYKFYGPHLGIMWGRRDLLDSLPASKVRPAKDAAPHRWETGTPSFETWNGLLACLTYWERLGEEYGDADMPRYAGRRLNLKRGLAAVSAYERALVAALIDGLSAIPGVAIAGITDGAKLEQRVPTVAMVKNGHDPADIAHYLARENVYVWSGDYYALEIMKRIERPNGMVRIGIGQYNTLDEINKVLNLLDDL